MSAAETMMWHVEADPWLAPSGGSITLFDRPLDFDRFRRSMARAVTKVPRLRHKVIEPTTPLGTPHWEVDTEFDFDWHVRQVGAPGDGSLRTLLDWLTYWLQDPYDRTRPLWQYVVIDGLADGRGALATKLHHVVADGKSAVRIAGTYTSPTRKGRDHPPVDLDGFIAREAAGEPPHASVVDELLRLPIGATKAAADALAHPGRLFGLGDQLGDLGRSVGDTMHAAGSPLWTERSRRRHLEAVSLVFDEVHDAAAALGGTVNDLFVTGAIEAAQRYHDQLGASLSRLHISFVVSTRGDGDAQRSKQADAANTFTPVPLDVELPSGDLGARFAGIRDVLHHRRSEVHGGGAMGNVAVIANLLPISVLTGITRNQAAHIDMATSNLPGLPGRGVGGRRVAPSTPTPTARSPGRH